MNCVFKYFLIFILLFSVFGVIAQTKSNKKVKQTNEKKNIFKDHKPSARDFHSIGHSLFGDMSLMPISRYSADSLSDFDTLPIFSRIKNYSFYHVSYFFRYNVFQIDDEKVFSLTLNPGLGLGLAESKKIKGFGSFTGSALFGFEYGAGSTYRSIEEKGFFIRLGAEYVYSPLIVFSENDRNIDGRFFFGPALSSGFRKEYEGERLIETNIKIGFATQKVQDDRYYVPFLFARSINFRVSFVIFLDH